MSFLNKLISVKSKSKKRVGRGTGSGKGDHTVGRGIKGQRSRTGGKQSLWFEGGQLPIIKRMPMLKGKGKFKPVRLTAELSLTDIENMKAKKINLETLYLEKIISRRFKKAKIINTGSINRAVEIEGILVSPSASKIIQKAGGVVV
ncbi:MAG: 50S ribosomal protein L15 [Patescibacteria group bacterium]